MVAGGKRGLGRRTREKQRKYWLHPGGFHHSRQLLAILENGGELWGDAFGQGCRGLPQPLWRVQLGRFYCSRPLEGEGFSGILSFKLQGSALSLGVHSERSIEGFCWGAPGAQHSSAPCLRPTTCSLCPGDTSRCVPEEIWHRWDV